MHVNTQMHILHFYVLYDCAQQNEDIVGLKLPHVNKVLYFVVVVNVDEAWDSFKTVLLDTIREACGI